MPHHQAPLSAQDLSKFEWTEEVSIEHGFSQLEKHFYPFKKVKYHKYLEAFHEAKKMNKFIHFILLWGALDVSIILSTRFVRLVSIFSLKRTNPAEVLAGP